MEVNNKDHWYDGLFYDKFIAPHQDASFDMLKDIIEDNSTLLDAGCGTGRLAFRLADKCRKIVGVDLSERNISVAKINLSNSSYDNIEFHHSDINKFNVKPETLFDYAVISYAIHEIEEENRKLTLNSLTGMARKIIIIDYLIPQPSIPLKILNEIVEFAAGWEHYRNYKSFLRNKGIEGLAKSYGMKIIRDIKNAPLTSHIAVLSR
jgi:tRNA/tmRNA/rRNA uracil-C5-methylase (TrmA/RlmC/RlmD family)